jgi:hypothetical protein
MKHIFALIFLFVVVGFSYAQDLSTLKDLHNFSISLGSSKIVTADSSLMIGRVGKMDDRLVEQLVNLLRSAEFYSLKDYASSEYYIKNVRINNRYPDYYNLKLLLIIGNYANLKDVKNTAKYYYIVNKDKFVNPHNLETIRCIIKENFTLDEFNDALAYYYYYHQRLKHLDEIGFEK